MKKAALLFVLSILSSQVFALSQQEKKFEQWKKAYIKRAAKRGLSPSFTSKILKDVKLDPSVIKKDRNQVLKNTKIDYQKFIKRWLRDNPSRIDRGKKELKKNYALLEKIEKKYGVDKNVIVALWGVETFYGEITGSYDLIRSLSTLAFEGRRGKFFEIQLNAALRLLKQGHVTRENLKGSWAGATGQCQFMPSNIPGYAVDFDGDGKKDIWTNKADIFASIANLLKKAGWQKGNTIGSLAINTRDVQVRSEVYRSKRDYKKLGFKSIDGKSFLDGQWQRRKLAYIPMENSPVVLRGGNYDPLLKWNNSSLFAAFNILLIDGFKN